MSRATRLAVVATFVAAMGASAADVSITSKKLVVVDKTSLAGTAKIVYVAKDGGIAKGPGVSLDMIDASFDLSYVGAGSVTGSFVLPAGAWNGSDGWKVNKSTVAKYVNKAAPSGPTAAKVAVVKPAKLMKLVGRSRGDVPIDVVTAGPPASGVETVFTITNGGVTTRHCSVFPVCTHKLIAGGTGAKLVCKNGVGNTCPAGGSTTTTVIATTTSTSIAVTSTTTSTSTSTSTSTTTSSTTTTSTIPTCNDGLQNGNETDVDCGGGTCPDCGPGETCLENADCTSSVCSAFVCLAASCSDGVQNGGETDVDCGGPCGNTCILTETCSVNGDCVSNSCNGGTCKCPSTGHTFQVNSNSGGLFDSAEWPGGSQVYNATSECTVTIQNPNDNIDLVCTLANPFAVIGSSGFSACFGTGGEDGDGCQPVSCPLLGIGSCCATRPSCSAALNGSGSAQYIVQCNP